MSNLKNTFGLPESLIDAVKQIHEKSHLSPKQKEIASKAGDPEKIDAEDFAALRKEKKLKTESAQLNELSPETLVSYAAKAKSSLKPGEVFPKRELGIQKAIQKASSKMNEQILEYDYKANQPGQYPFNSAQLTPFFTMLRSLMDIIQKTPALKKLMRDETGIDDVQLDPLLEFLQILHEEVLLEGLVEGKKEDDDEEVEPESEDEKEKEKEDKETGKNPIMQLKAAADRGSFLTTNSGPRYVNQNLAKQILTKLSGLKPDDREDHVGKIVSGDHNEFSSKINQSHENKPEGMEAPVEKKRGRKPKQKD